MTNQIQARAVIRNLNAPGVEIKVWLSKFVTSCNALSADSADHATSC